ncbi:hypothetical protein [Bacillus cereus]|uniref:hypothetical protein n=1 Tax=Bacillus cereus TaxID=1396 RepID=UPI0024BCACE2|nr:hypothetical protein [Bacillus cereus]WHT85435.1 hypothetical protein QM225_000802 [Bacillus cereus]
MLEFFNLAAALGLQDSTVPVIKAMLEAGYTLASIISIFGSFGITTGLMVLMQSYIRKKLFGKAALA